MKEIDLQSWKRKEHYQFFSRMDYPHFNICFDLEITKILPIIKSNNLPFYYTMIYLSTISANQIEEFRYRRRNFKVILHEKVNPAFTDMDGNSDLFKMVTSDISNDVVEFVNRTKRKSDEQKGYFIASDFADRDDYIFITSIPWISFTHISHTISLNSNDSTPRISWGKYYSKENRIFLPFSVQVHHAFADGIHVGRYKEILEENIEKFDLQ